MLRELLLFTVLGTGVGVVYAGLGLALLVTFRGSGVLNFAQGAIAMWAAYVYDGLRTTGQLYFPVVGIPDSVRLGGPAPLWAAVGAAVLSAVVLSVLAQLLVFRPLRNAPDLAKVVASVGLMLLVQAVASVAFGTQQQVVPSVLSSSSFSLAGQSVPWSDVELLAVAVAVTAALWAYFRFTRWGLATLASAENEPAVALLGRSPSLLAAGAWALSGAVAGLFGVLIAPVIGLSIVNYTLFVVPALAIVLLARLRSLGVTCAAGIVLGVLQSLLDYVKTISWYPSWAQNGVEQALPLVVIVVVLALSGDRLPGRGAAEEAELPGIERPRRPALTLAVLGAVSLAALVFISGIYRFGVIETLVAAIVMESFVLLTGYMGQISLAQLAIAGIGGLLAAKLGAGAGVPFPLAPLLAALAATACGLVVALPALRIRGMQLAVVTLAFAITVEEFVFDNPGLNPQAGLPTRGPRLFGWNLAVREGNDIARLSFGLLVLVLLLLVVAAVLNLARSRTGLRMIAVRANERGAASVGIDGTSTKLLAFGSASFVAGLGGAMMAYATGEFSAASFDALAAGLPFLAFAYLGGITSVAGGLVAGVLAPAGIVYVLLNRYVDNLGPYYLVVSGAALVVAAIANPEGMTGAYRRTVRSRAAAAGARRASTVQSAAGATLRVPRRARSAAPTGLPPAVPPRATGEPGTLAPRGPLPEPTRPQGMGESRPGDATLVVEDLVVAYGGVRAVEHVAFTLAPGRIVGLIGPNGAGKTSLVDAITGFARASGSVRLEGRQLLGMRAHAIARAGVVRTWQAPALFGDLTVAEDLTVATLRPGAWSVLHDVVTLRAGGLDADITWALEVVGCAELASRRTEDLPLGQQKLIAVARALAARPRVLLLDEPAAGLDTDESRRLGEHLRQVAQSGVTVLLVEHDMDLVFGTCDEVLVLQLGRIIASGCPAEVQADPLVRASYLGWSCDDAAGGTVGLATGTR